MGTKTPLQQFLGYARSINSSLNYALPMTPSGTALCVSPVGDFNFAVAKGEVERAEWNYKFGFSPAVSLSYTTVWENSTSYIYLTTATALFASSTDVGDTQTTIIAGLDSNWDVQVATVTLNGQTQVSIPGLWQRVFRGYNDDDSNYAGKIYIATESSLTSGVPTNTAIKAMINNGNNQTLMTMVTVPNSMTLYLHHWQVSTSKSKDVDSILVTREFGKTFRVRANIDVFEGQSEVPFHYAVKFPAKTDIEVRSKTSAGTAPIRSSFDYILLGDK
jgi:hypothetical protein